MLCHRRRRLYTYMRVTRYKYLPVLTGESEDRSSGQLLFRGIHGRGVWEPPAALLWQRRGAERQQDAPSVSSNGDYRMREKALIRSGIGLVSSRGKRRKFLAEQASQTGARFCNKRGDAEARKSIEF